MRQIKIVMCCGNCRSSEYIRVTDGYLCNKHGHSVYGKWPCEDWLPSKPDVRLWIKRKLGLGQEAF